MILPEFEYQRPKDLKAVLGSMEQLDQTGREYLFLAGGTDLLPQLKRGPAMPDVVISLSQVKELSGIHKTSDGWLNVGPMTSLDQLIEDRLIKAETPWLSEVAKKVASPQIRHQATVGGNILVDNRCKFFNQPGTNRDSHSACFKAFGEVCHLIPNATQRDAATPTCRARFVSDLAPMLILMDAEIRLQKTEGMRDLSLKSFYSRDGLMNSKVGEGEILTAIRIPQVAAGSKIYWGYEKLRIRNAIDFPSLGVAMKLQKLNNQKLLSVCLTGVETYPVFLEFSEKDLGKDFLEEVCRRAMKSVTPIKQDFFSPQYRKQMVSVLISRWLEDQSKDQG